MMTYYELVKFLICSGRLRCKEQCVKIRDAT